MSGSFRSTLFGVEIRSLTFICWSSPRTSRHEQQILFWLLRLHPLSNNPKHRLLGLKSIPDRITRSVLKSVIGTEHQVLDERPLLFFCSAVMSCFDNPPNLIINRSTLNLGFFCN